MFTPKWKKEGKLLVKGAAKFVNYKRDLLKPERVEEIESRKRDLQKALKDGDRAKADEASKQLRVVCENSLPREKPQGWFEENVEVMFVAIVIALGLRAYYLQPFRIPTGSMQPTLNGIVGTPMKKEDWPSFPQRVAEYVLRGRSYARIEIDQDKQIAISPDGRALVGDYQFFHFFSRSKVVFSDSRPNVFSQLWGSDPLRLPAPLSQMFEIGLGEAMNRALADGGRIPAGTVLAEGYIDSGDLVLVDKFSYHFRKPKRGEVFVFDTQGIKGIHERSGEQAAGSHYIKRLCGVPGDTLSIQQPDLLIDGKVADEPGIRKVVAGGAPFPDNHPGYALANPERALPGGRVLYQYLSRPEDRLILAKDAPPGMREYAALGDNTANSLDSRYWGTVREYNLVGPALFSLWPFTTGHWGFIR